MSGIAGIFYTDGRPVDRPALEDLMAPMAFRGPDGVGLWVEDNVGLGHLQMRTTPESLAEEQPALSRDGRYVITWDGRLDNREELVSALAGVRGVSPSTPDPDLVLAAYTTWGKDALKRLVGDFAFVIWDRRTRNLFCARDPLGIRHIYYFQDKGRFIFASDVKAILAQPGVPYELDVRAVAQYLLNPLLTSDRSPFREVLQLPPATHLTVGEHGVSKEAYWTPEPWDQITYPRVEDYVGQFNEVFRAAVRSRLRSLTPVGISLSGGMDSTSIACVAAHLVQSGDAAQVRLQTFSSVFQDFPAVDESAYIRQVLDAWRLDGSFLVADDLWAFKPLQRKETVLSRPYPVPFKARHEGLLTQAKNAGVRVMLTGEGGDEAFAIGFTALLELLRTFRIGKFFEEMRYLTPLSRRLVYRQLLWRPLPSGVRRAYSRLRGKRAPQWLDQRFLEASGALRAEELPLDPPKSSSAYVKSQFSSFASIGYSSILAYLTEMYAHYEVEARHPFLDRRVIDFVCRVPPHVKFSHGWSKVLLREAMKDLLPERVRTRPQKTTFTDVFNHGLKSERERILALLENGRSIRSGWVKKERLQEAFDLTTSGAIPPGDGAQEKRQLLSFLTFEDWVQPYFGSSGSLPSQSRHSTVLLPQERR
jgi:asparagine synthase (glutamine-hydrolysing)